MDTQAIPARRAAHRKRASEEAAFDQLLIRVRANLPPDMTPEEIEREIAEARREARQERRARGR